VYIPDWLNYPFMKRVNNVSKRLYRMRFSEGQEVVKQQIKMMFGQDNFMKTQVIDTEVRQIGKKE